ncbi:MAG: hypothetical protein AB7O52_01590 [Planctomycetota bacterium]
MTQVFISYRRSENPHVAHRLFAELQKVVREEDLFFDRSEAALGPGALWPRRTGGALHPPRCEPEPGFAPSIGSPPSSFGSRLPVPMHSLTGEGSTAARAFPVTIAE